MSELTERQSAEHAARIVRTTCLTGHTSPDTAYLVDDYPYGFVLRTQIRYWLEHKKGHGFRLMSQTRNPKREGIVWNKPKASTYYVCAVMILDPDTGHVHLDALSAGGWSTETAITAYESQYADALTDEHKRAIRYIRATNKANDMITVTVTAGHEDSTPRQSREEQLDVWNKAIAIGYSQLPN